MDHVLVAAHAFAAHAAKAATNNATQKRHLTEIGLGLAAIGAVVLALAAAFGVRSMSRTIERGTMILAGILMAVGFIIQFFGVHGSK
jgi:hypothetical protein